jgi:hypothetical protein
MPPKEEHHPETKHEQCSRLRHRVSAGLRDLESIGSIAAAVVLRSNEEGIDGSEVVDADISI